MNFKQDFTDYVHSGHSLLSIKTHEKNRCEKDIIDTMTQEGYQVLIWSVATGLRRPDGQVVAEGIQEPQAAIQATISTIIDEKAVFILRDFGPYVHHETYNESDVVISWITEVQQALSNSRKVIVFLGPDFLVPLPLRHDITEIEYALPDNDSIEKAVRYATADVVTSDGESFVLPEKQLPNVVQACRSMTESQIIDRVTLALRKTKGLDGNAIKILLYEKASIIRSSGLLNYSDPIEGGLDMVGGLDLLKKHVQLDLPCFSQKAQEFGIEFPKGILLVGVPGCGKTLLSIAISSAFNYPLIQMDVGNIMNKFVGESEGNMSEAIRILESVAPAVLQLDEIEKGFGGAGGETDGGSSQRVFGKFLKWLNDRVAPIYVVATANNVSILPPEFSRKGRFDECFAVDLPEPCERLEIFKIHISKRNRKPNQFDLDKLVNRTNGFTGADIEMVVKMGLKLAFHQDTDLTQETLEEAISSIKPLVETEPERISAIREWGKSRAKPASSASQVAQEIQKSSTRKVNIKG